MLESNFSTLDWLIVVLYLGATVGIGIYANRFVGSLSDYMVAGRSLRSALSIATMVGSELGLVTVMYAAQTGLTRGFAALHIGVVAGLATLIVGLTGFIVVPLRRLGVMTIPEFYGKRFGRPVRVVGALLLAGAGILNMGLFLKAGALFVTGLTGLSDPAAVNWVMTGLLAIVLIYTTLGGMISVVITDYVQFVILSFGMIVTCLLALKNLGWQQLTGTVHQLYGDAGFDPSHAEGFGLAYVAWMFFSAGLVSSAVWQTAVMRACAADSTETVRRLYLFSSIGFLVRFLLPQFLGICALVYFWQGDQRAVLFDADGQMLVDSDVRLQAMPMYLGQLLPTGVAGLVGAAMLAAFMSTHDSYLLCWATVLAYDVVQPLSRDRLTDRGCLLVARLLIVLIGGFLLVWGLWYPLGQNLWDYMAVTGAIYFTGAFAVLVGGLYWKQASSTGAMLALLAGTASVVGLEPVQALCGIDVAPEMVGLGTTAAALVLMVLGSIIVPDAGQQYSQFGYDGS